VTATAAIEIDQLSHRYKDREALKGVSFGVGRGEIFSLLGPNGSGKTTLFRILSTLLRPSGGRASILGFDLAKDPAQVRRRIGVVFQSPSIDGKLTVLENLRHHGRLYGLGGIALRERIGVVMNRLGIADRRGDRVETLSGGLQRRVELAKGLLPKPDVLLLDEPSTGLDPAARRELGRYLEELREEDRVTVVLTTHYLEEAERSDRVAILHQGDLVSIGAPDALKASVGGDVVVIHTDDAAALSAAIRERFGIEAKSVDGTLRVERPRGHELIRDLVEAFPAQIKSVTFGKPTLEDVFVHLTGDRFWNGAESSEGRGEAP
jgi:ABC-2 type transport system ATP-binding protein